MVTELQCVSLIRPTDGRHWKAIPGYMADSLAVLTEAVFSNNARK